MKQIYAALQISEEEVRLLVGEYFNTRFNIIKLEKVPCKGVTNFRISDRDEVKRAVKEACENASRMIGARIEQVILILPSLKVKRYPLKVNMETRSGYLTKEDAGDAISEALRSSVDRELIIINAVPIRYTVNGISSRRLPEKEVCSTFSVDVDLLCGEKEAAYDYVEMVYECGLKVMDICLDSYATGKEAALFEQTLNQNMILIDAGKSVTTLSLLSKGKLVSCEALKEGLGKTFAAAAEKYGIPLSSSERLAKYNCSYGKEYSQDAIFAWNNTRENLTLNEGELSACVRPALEEYIGKLVTTCQPILDSGPASITVVGDGAEMDAFCRLLEEKSTVAVRAYFPETIGVRDSNLTALYGSFFVYRDMNEIRGNEKSSIDLYELENVISRKTDDAEAETLTSKIRSLFEMSRKKEEEE